MSGIAVLLVICGFCFFSLGGVHLVAVAVNPPVREIDEITPTGATLFGIGLIATGIVFVGLAQLALQ